MSACRVGFLFISSANTAKRWNSAAGLIFKCVPCLWITNKLCVAVPRASSIHLLNEIIAWLCKHDAALNCDVPLATGRIYIHFVLSGTRFKTVLRYLSFQSNDLETSLGLSFRRENDWFIPAASALTGKQLFSSILARKSTSGAEALVN